MERELIDILVDEREAINELGELNRRIEKAERRRDRIFEAFELGIAEEEAVRKAKYEVEVMTGMHTDYLDILKTVHEEMLVAVVKATAPISITGPNNLKPEKITVEFAKNVMEKSRDVEHKIIRKGRVLRGSTNKIQN